MKNYTEKLFDELAEELTIYADLGTLPVRKVTGAIHSIQNAFAKLRKYIAETPFKTPDEEIHFFKYEKPRFTAEHFYAMEIFSIETARPLNDMNLLKAFYEQELKYIRRLFNNNRFLYAYYQFDLKDLDHSLFIRGAKPVDIPVPDVIGGDPQFTTCCDNIWGKFMAFERLEVWLLDELRALDKSEAGLQAPASGEERGKLAIPPGALKWTGETINLVEIAYGIWLTGQINNGNVSITELMEFLEVVFRVRVGKPHRRWQSLTRRERLGAFRFVDEMMVALQKRLEEELEM
jgi:hypothetical protein